MLAEAVVEAMVDPIHQEVQVVVVPEQEQTAQEHQDLQILEVVVVALAQHPQMQILIMVGPEDLVL
jgi:hypothetical protein